MASQDKAVCGPTNERVSSCAQAHYAARSRAAAQRIARNDRVDSAREAQPAQNLVYRMIHSWCHATASRPTTALEHGLHSLRVGDWRESLDTEDGSGGRSGRGRCVRADMLGDITR